MVVDSTLQSVMVNAGHMFVAHDILHGSFKSHSKTNLLKATANLSNMFEMGRMVTSDASCAIMIIARRFLRNDL